MIELGDYTASVLSAWAISVLLLAGLVVQTVAANARARKRLQEVERRRG